MDQHTISVLEFNKVLKILEHFCYSQITIESFYKSNFYSNSGILKTKLSEVKEFIQIYDNNEYFPLSSFKDIRSFLRKLHISGSFLTPREYYDILEFLIICRKLSKVDSKEFRERYPLTLDKLNKIDSLEELAKEIDNRIDDKLEIKDNASKELAKIRKELTDLKSRYHVKTQELLQRYIRNGILREGYVTIRNGHNVYPIKSQNRTALSGIVYDMSDSGNTLFIEPMELVNFDNKITQLELEEKKEVDKVLLDIANQIRKYLSEIDSNLKILSYIDSLHARACFANEFKASIPNINDQGVLKIVDGYHPVLLLKQKPSLYEFVENEQLKEKLENIVPLSIDFGKENNNFVLITGPNTGGKTVALKTIGLLVLMTYLAIPIPASADTDIPIFYDIFADVGDEQSIERGLSTFSSHVLNLIKLLKLANEKTLVLIDEIGNGTDPDDGGILGMAVIDDLIKKNAKGVITTHYGSLKAYAFEKKGIVNASMEFNSVDLEPTYHLRPSVPGNSYAMDIARNLGMPEHIIENALEKKDNKEIRMDEIILNLQAKVTSYEAKLQELGVKESQLSSLLDNYKEKKQHLDEFYQEEKDKALQEAHKIVSDAKSVVEKVVSEIKVTSASKESIKKSHSSIDDLKGKVEEDITSRKKSDIAILENPKPGDIVWIDSIQSPGEIITISHHGPKVQIKVGNFKMLTTRDDLFPLPNDIAEKPAEETAQSDTNYMEYSGPVSYESDVRGLSADEAIKKVEVYLSDVSITDMNQVRIIHGIGNGILRNFIHEFLKKFPSVKDFCTADIDSGGEGVTIVTLK